MDRPKSYPAERDVRLTQRAGGLGLGGKGKLKTEIPANSFCRFSPKHFNDARRIRCAQAPRKKDLTKPRSLETIAARFLELLKNPIAVPQFIVCDFGPASVIRCQIFGGRMRMRISASFGRVPCAI
jgi:hypothetical protein